MTKSISKPINIGIVGLNFGRWILDDLVHEDLAKLFKIAAVCDINDERRNLYANRLGVKAYSNLDDLLEDKDIPVIGLFTGPVHRADLLRKIIRAGKDVMTTKPFEIDSAAARSVLEEAKAMGRTIHLNSPTPEPSNWVRQVQLWQKEFDLGRVISAHAEAVVSYREAADGTWFDDPKLCPVAPVFRIGIYMINDLVELLGGVEQVQVSSSRIFTGRPTSDNAQLSLVFKNKAIASVFASFCIDDGQYYGNSIILHYERGTIWRNCDPVAYGTANIGSRLRVVAKCGEREVTIQSREFPDLPDHGYQWSVFRDAVTGQPCAPMPIDTVVQGVEIVEAMTAAEASGCSVYLPR